MTMTGKKKRDASELFPPFWDDVICWSKRHQSGMTNSSFAQKENWKFCSFHNFVFIWLDFFQGRNVCEFNTGFMGIDHISRDMFVNVYSELAIFRHSRRTWLRHSSASAVPKCRWYRGTGPKCQNYEIFSYKFLYMKFPFFFYLFKLYCHCILTKLVNQIKICIWSPT